MTTTQKTAGVVALASVLATAGSVAVSNYLPDWKSYQQTGNPADIVSSPTVAAAIGGKVDAVNGQSQGQSLTSPAVTGGSITQTDASGAKSIPSGGSVARSLAAHFADTPNVTDYGAVGDGTTDSGGAIATAAAQSPIISIPHSSSPYVLNTGSFPGGTYPNYNWSFPNNTGVYSPVGFWSLGNNQFTGSAIGSPDKCTGSAFSPYTQPCLIATDYKIVMDPASIWQGPNTTNAGLSIGCLPNHKSTNAANTSNGYNRNWIACVYTEADTGSDGQANSAGSGFGSSISTEWINRTLDIASNHGIMQEDNVNVREIPVDGGITRDLFILASASFRGAQSIVAGKSPWTTNSGFAEAAEINATPFTTTTQPATAGGNGEAVWTSTTTNGTTTYTVYPRWTRGISVSGSVDDFVEQVNVAGESGNLLRGIAANGTNYLTIDKVGNFKTNGFVSVSNANYYVSNGRFCLDTQCARYVYEANNTIRFGNTTNGDVASISDSGNLTIKGALTQNGTP